jgi:hypothetical protein
MIANLPIKLKQKLKPRGHFSWEYHLRDTKLRRLDFVATLKQIDSTSDDWVSNGKITSLHDLLGTQLIVQLVAPGQPVDFSGDTINEYRQAIDLTELIIRLPNGIVMRFDDDNFKRFTGKDTLAFYLFTFPKTMTELIKATEYKRFKKLHDDYGDLEKKGSEKQTL